MRTRAFLLIFGLSLVSLLLLDTGSVWARATSGGSRGSRSYSSPVSPSTTPSSPYRATQPSPSTSQPPPIRQRPGMFGGFPGNRELTVYIGVLQYVDTCTPPPLNFGIHAVSGVATNNHPVSLFPAPPGVGCPSPALPHRSVIDLQNMIPIAQAVAANANLPGVGALFASTIVWNLNAP